ncbi:hypothetical protein HKD37_15G042897 [Glycine soja]
MGQTAMRFENPPFLGSGPWKINYARRHGLRYGATCHKTIISQKKIIITSEATLAISFAHVHIPKNESLVKEDNLTTCYKTIISQKKIIITMDRDPLLFLCFNLDSNLNFS